MKFKKKTIVRIFFILVAVIIMVSCNKKTNEALKSDKKNDEKVISKKQIDNNIGLIENRNVDDIVSIKRKNVNENVSIKKDNNYETKIDEDISPNVITQNSNKEESSNEENLKDDKENDNIFNIITSNVYKIEKVENIKILIGMNEGTLLGEIKENLLNENNIVKIYNEENEELNDDESVKTGQVLKIEVEGEKVDEAIIILKGDVNCDGKIDITDKTIIKNHVLGKEKIINYKKYAGDIVIDNIIDALDLEKIENYILGKITTLN